jgi:hypothetical protein
LLDTFQRALAAAIIAHGADEVNLVRQIASVQGEVERRTAQVLRSRENVPQYFADADDFHASPNMRGYTIFSNLSRRASQSASGCVSLRSETAEEI